MWKFSLVLETFAWFYIFLIQLKLNLMQITEIREFSLEDDFPAASAVEERRKLV